MFEFDTDVDKKLNAPNKRKIYDMLVGRAKECLKSAKSVCLLGLSNWRYGEWILAENKNVERVTIVESSQLKFMYKDLEKLNKYNIIYVNDDKYVEALEGLSMKFDCIIMNPPYSRNLHLKILAEAIKHLKDEKSVCVNLSPVRWLQDPLAKYKKASEFLKYEDSIAKHIVALDTVVALDAAGIFEAGFWANLGICTLAKGGDFKVYEGIAKEHFGPFKWKFVEKIGLPLYQGNLSGICTVFSRFSQDKHLPYWVKCSRVHGHPGKKDEFDCITPKLDLVLNKTGHEGKEVYFATRDEAVNFFNYLNLTFCKFIKSLGCYPLDDFNKGLPFLGDAINPRTGLKGYTGEWTDADFYEFFNITPKEQKVIEETMEKYK